VPKEPDRSHLADAIHFMDLIDLADEELPAWSSATSTVPVVLCQHAGAKIKVVARPLVLEHEKARAA
jgi:hypothetical protein